MLAPLLAVLIALAPSLCAGQSFEKILWASSKGDVQTVGTLLNQGLDPNTADSDGHTLLMLAARNGPPSCANQSSTQSQIVRGRNAGGNTKGLM